MSNKYEKGFGKKPDKEVNFEDIIKKFPNKADFIKHYENLDGKQLGAAEMVGWNRVYPYRPFTLEEFLKTNLTPGLIIAWNENQHTFPVSKKIFLKTGPDAEQLKIWDYHQKKARAERKKEPKWVRSAKQEQERWD